MTSNYAQEVWFTPTTRRFVGGFSGTLAYAFKNTLTGTPVVTVYEGTEDVTATYFSSNSPSRSGNTVTTDTLVFTDAHRGKKLVFALKVVADGVTMVAKQMWEIEGAYDLFGEGVN